MKRVFLLVSSLVLVEVMFYSVLSPLLPYYVRQLHLSKADAGLLTACYAIGGLAFSIPAGFWVARVGAQRVVVGSLFALAATSVAFGFGDSIIALDVARFAQGIAGSCVWAGGLAWLAAEGPAERRGELVGGAMGVAIGGAVMGPVVGSFAELTNPRLTFSLVAGVMLGLGLAAMKMRQPATGYRHRMGELLSALRSQRGMIAGSWSTAVAAALFGVLSVLGPLRLSALGAGTLGVAATFLVSASIEGVASPFIGRASDRRGSLVMVRLALGASSLAALLLPVPETAWLLALAIVIGGLSFGAVFVPATALLTTGAEAHGLDLGIAFALWNMAWAAGQTAGSALGAQAAQVTSDAVPYVALSGLCIVTLVLIGRQRVDVAVQLPSRDSSAL